MKAKNRLLMMLMYMNHGLKSYCRPMVRSSGLITCPMYAVAYAPTMPEAVLNTTRNGIRVIRPSIFGSIKKFAELTPIMSRASICCVTRIVPISEAMFEPTFPARIRHIIDDENSSSMISRVT